MGVLNATVGVGHTGSGNLTEVSAVVDTGAVRTMLTESLLAQLRIRAIVE